MNSKTTEIRETFGLIDPLTGKRYQDIQNAFLLTLRITEQDKIEKRITLSTNNLSFFLHCDSKVKKEIKEKGFCDCIVSFQIRTDIKIALARKLQNIAGKEGN
jgi:hypothetical protein